MTMVENICVSFRDSLGSLSLDLSFETPLTGVTALFGPSGSGKTTLLRCIAGLHRAPFGRCIIGADIWQSETYFKPVYERPIGFVFQEASLFPHLSVKNNLLFGVGEARKDRVRQFTEVVQLLGVENLLDRMPGKLSGGERQRVAIGRALLSDPGLLLMDEPLSALDAASREEIMPYLERLQASLDIPVLYVSHDMNEIDRFADHLVLIDKGRVVANGPLARVQSDPTFMLASLPHAAVSLYAEVVAYDFDFKIARFEVSGGYLNAPSQRLAVGDKRRLKVYAGDVSLSRERATDSSIDNQIPVRIVAMREVEPAQVIVFMTLGHDSAGERLLARITKKSWVTLGLDIGQSLFAQVKAVALIRRGL